MTDRFQPGPPDSQETDSPAGETPGIEPGDSFSVHGKSDTAHEDAWGRADAVIDATALEIDTDSDPTAAEPAAGEQTESAESSAPGSARALSTAPSWVHRALLWTTPLVLLGGLVAGYSAITGWTLVSLEQAQALLVGITTLSILLSAVAYLTTQRP